MIEACVGAIYIREGKVITETFRQCIQELLDCCLLAGRNPYSVLMVYLQSKGINNPADYVNTTQHCETAEFQSSIQLLDGSIIEGAFSSNKSGAEHNLAIKALEAIGNEELKSIGIDIEQVNLEPIPAKSISLSSFYTIIDGRTAPIQTFYSQ